MKIKHDNNMSHKLTKNYVASGIMGNSIHTKQVNFTPLIYIYNFKM